MSFNYKMFPHAPCWSLKQIPESIKNLHDQDLDGHLFSVNDTAVMVETQMMEVFKKVYEANNRGLKEISVNISYPENAEIILQLFQIATQVYKSQYIKSEITRINQIPSFHMSWEVFPRCYSDLKNEFDRYSDLLMQAMF